MENTTGDKSSGNYPLTGTVHVDEFYVGNKEEEETLGRSSNSKKKLAIVALEVQDNGGESRAYGLFIDDDSAASFRPFFEKYISQ